MNARSYAGRREHGDGKVRNVVSVVAPIEFPLDSPDDGANTINQTDNGFAGTSEMKVWIHAAVEDYVAGSDDLTIKLYRGNKYVGETTVVLIDATAGNATPVSAAVSNMIYCDKAVITGTITVPVGGKVEVFLGKLGQV